MRLALGAGAVVGVLAPAVGFFLVQRRQSLVGDGIGHVAFAGVAAGILLDVSPILTALVAALLGGVAIEFLRSKGKTAGDQALALVFYTGIAAGVVLISAAGALNVDLFQYLFGSILTVSRSDLALISVLGAVGLATVGLLYRPLAGIVVDEEGRPRRRRPDRCAQRDRRGAGRGDSRPVHAGGRDPARGGAHGPSRQRGDPDRVEHALGVPPVHRRRPRLLCSRG